MRIKILQIFAFVFLIIISFLNLSCRQKITIEKLRGEWVAEKFCYYLNFKNDSLTFIQPYFSIFRSNKKENNLYNPNRYLPFWI